MSERMLDFRLDKLPIECKMENQCIYHRMALKIAACMSDKLPHRMLVHMSHRMPVEDASMYVK